MPDNFYIISNIVFQNEKKQMNSYISDNRRADSVVPNETNWPHGDGFGVSHLLKQAHINGIVIIQEEKNAMVLALIPYPLQSRTPVGHTTWHIAFSTVSFRHGCGQMCEWQAYREGQRQKTVPGDY